MNIGQFVAAEIIIILIIASVEKIITALDSIYDVLTALEKIGYVTDLPLDNQEGNIPIEVGQGIDITLENLNFKFPDKKENILKDINLKIPNKQVGNHLGTLRQR